MKRGALFNISFILPLFILVILVILVIPLALALEIKTDKTQFSQGETFFATLSGNILENIEIQDVGFYRANVQIPLTFDITKLNNIYYIYAILPYTKQNYTLKIKDVYYQEANQIKTSTLEKNFQIINQTADFNVNPGFIIASNNFTLSLHNNLDSDLEITYILENNSYAETLPLQQTTKLTILIDKISSTNLTSMEIKSASLSYKIPLYLIKSGTNLTLNGTSPDNNTITNGTFQGIEKLRFSGRFFSVDLNKNELIMHKIYLMNYGELNATNVSLVLSPELKDYVSVSPNKFDFIKSGREVTSNREDISNREAEANLTFKFTKTGNFTGFLFANSTNSSGRLWLEFRVGTNVTFNSSIKDEKTCLALGGKKCPICYGTSIIASDGLCCKNCEPPAKSKTNWTAIYIVVGLLILILAFVFLKFRKPKTSARDILDKKSKSFSDRFETKGSLSRE